VDDLQSTIQVIVFDANIQVDFNSEVVAYYQRTYSATVPGQPRQLDPGVG
jgi:hypothetical protein